jgi:multidrug efflux system outer membrane protein
MSASGLQALYADTNRRDSAASGETRFGTVFAFAMLALASSACGSRGGAPAEVTVQVPELSQNDVLPGSDRPQTSGSAENNEKKEKNSGTDPKGDSPFRELPPRDSGPPPSLDLPAQGSGKPVKLGMNSLRKLLLEGNTSVLLSANRVHQAKEQVNIARGNLLMPSLSLTALATLGSNGSFALSGIDFLLPFLIPSNWFDYTKSKHLLDSEKVAFLLMELNQYASVSSLYFSYVNDMAFREFLLETVKNFEKIELSTERAYVLGTATAEEVRQARSQTQLARVRVTRVNELITQELGALRYSLGLDSNTPLVIEDAEVVPLAIERARPSDAIELARQRAPEAAQLNSLTQAAKAERWSKIFGFISGGVLSKMLVNMFGGGDGGGTMPWMASGSLNFGFAYYPAIKLTQHQLKELDIRNTELNLELGRLVDTLMGRLMDASRRYTFAVQAEENLESIVESRRAAYEIGQEDFWAVFYARNQAIEASMERLRTRGEIFALRIALQRALLEGEFASIRGCPDPNLRASKKKGGFFLWGWMKGIFGGGSKKSDQPDWLTVEKVCQG